MGRHALPSGAPIGAGRRPDALAFGSAQSARTVSRVIRAWSDLYHLPAKRQYPPSAPRPAVYAWEWSRRHLGEDDAAKRHFAWSAECGRANSYASHAGCAAALLDLDVCEDASRPKGERPVLAVFPTLGCFFALCEVPVW